MQFKELTQASGCSAASIKYYRREGLLPAGDHVTATRQEYGDRHLERLQLIKVLREVAGAPITAIRRLTEMLDDPEVPQIRSLQEAQGIALGGHAIDGTGPPPTPEHPTVAHVLERMHWPDIDSIPRRALDETLQTLTRWRLPTDPDTIVGYAEPIAAIARADVDYLRRSAQTGDDFPLGPPTDATDGHTTEGPTDDVVVMRAVAGTIAYDRLLQVLRALGHTSLSVRDSEQSSDHHTASAAENE